MSRRVLIVSSQVRSVHSGVGTYADLLLRGLAEVDADELEVTVATWEEEIDSERHPGFEWIELGNKPTSDPTPGCFWTLGRRLVLELAAVDGELPYETVHFLDAREGHAFLKSRMRDGIEVIGTVHDDYAAQVSLWPWHYVGAAADPWRRWLFHRWMRRVEKQCYRRFDILMMNSQATGETVRRAYGLDKERMMDVSLTVQPVAPKPPQAEALDAAALDVIAAETNAADERLLGEPSLLFSGGNFYRKGLDVLIAALPQILESLPGAHLHVAGSCRSSKKIEALVQKVGVGESVTFHGRLEPSRVAQMMMGVDVFVMPSRTEALGLVYLEAFRAGVPVIAGDHGGVCEIVHDRKSGLQVTPGCPAAVASAVAAMAGDASLQQVVIAGGYEVLMSRTPELMVSQTLDAYGIEIESPTQILDAIPDEIPVTSS